MVHCGSAFEPGASGLPYYCASHLCSFLLYLARWLCEFKTKKTKKVPPAFFFILTSDFSPELI